MFRKAVKAGKVFLLVVMLAVVVAGAVMTHTGTVYAKPSEPDLPEEFKQSQFSAQTVLDGIANILRWLAGLGLLVTVGALIFMGFKLATSAGNYQKRAQVIEGLPYVIGGGLLVSGGAWFLASLLTNLVNWIFKAAPIS